MAEFTFTDNTSFPPGTELNVYEASEWNRGYPEGEPEGDPVATETLDADGVTFTGLDEGGEYYVAAEVGDDWRFVRIYVPRGQDYPIDQQFAEHEASAPSVVAQSGVALSHSETGQDELVEVTIPANSMGPNGRIRITALWSCNESATYKQPRIYFSGGGGTMYGFGHLTTTAISFKQQVEIANRNDPASQIGGHLGAQGGWSTGDGAALTSTADTTEDTTVSFQANLEDGADTLTLQSYLVELFPG